MEIVYQFARLGQLSALQVETQGRLFRQKVRAHDQFAMPFLQAPPRFRHRTLGFRARLRHDCRTDGAHARGQQQDDEKQHQAHVAGQQ